MRRRTRHSLLAIITATLAGTISTTGCETDHPASSPPRATPAAEPAGSIDFPLNGARVSWEQPVNGKAQNIPPGRQLWLLVRYAQRYHPQGAPLSPRPDGSWSGIVTVGNEPDPRGTRYILRLALVDQPTGQQLSRYLSGQSAIKRYPGIPENQISSATKYLDDAEIVRE